MAGISSRAAGTLENKKQYNGIEHTTDLDLNQYDAFYRTLDPQIGRFWQIDPQTEALESYSPYESMGNNPITNVDPMGNFKTKFGAWLHTVFNGGEIGQNTHGEYYVSKTDVSVGENGEAVATAKVSYGKGRDKLSAAREKLLEEVEQEADDQQTKKNLTDAGLWDPNLTAEEAKRNLINNTIALSLPTPVNGVVKAESAAGEMSVYISVSNGVTQYAGITNNVARRAAEHLAGKGINIQPLMTGLSMGQARAVEQALIEIHGLSKNGGTLLNKINSIAASNPTYSSQLKQGYELLKSIGYK